MNMQALSQPQAPAAEAMLSREELAAVRAQMQHALHDPEEGFVAFWEAHGVDREHGGESARPSSQSEFQLNIHPEPPSNPDYTIMVAYRYK